MFLFSESASETLAMSIAPTTFIVAEASPFLTSSNLATVGTGLSGLMPPCAMTLVDVVKHDQDHKIGVGSCILARESSCNGW